MARLIAIADTHCGFDRIEAAIAIERAVDPDTCAVLHAEDLGIYDRESPDRLTARELALIERHDDPIELSFEFLAGARLALPLVGIPGNHEDFHLVRRFEAGTLELPGFRLLAPGDCEELRLGGRTVRVMGLGRTAPGGRRGPSHFDDSALELAGARGEQERPDILLLHDAPLLQVQGQRRRFGARALTRLVERVRPRLVLAGHIHLEYRAEVAGVPVVGLGYGLKGRYAVVDEELQVEFCDLHGRPPTTRAVFAPRP